MSQQEKLILDVDTGVDDAFALLFAAQTPLAELLAVTCVDGNVPLPQVVKNTLKTLDMTNTGHIQVARGARHPIKIASQYTGYFGNDGLFGIEPMMPKTKRRTERKGAVSIMCDLINKHPGEIILVALAPLTNVAHLIHKFPSVARKLKRIVIMGGGLTERGISGNATPFAEFNIYHDPEAADIVFSSGIPLTMFGLEVYSGPTVDMKTAEKLGFKFQVALKALAT